MPRIAYKEMTLGEERLKVVNAANIIILEYQAQGFNLTLRQLYYQFVARGYIPNRLQEYKKLGDVLNEARLQGLVDWDAIEDRTRELSKLPDWESPESVLGAVAKQYREDLWASQPTRVEVWIEKDALEGVFEQVCNRLRVPFFSCRGYASQSSIWEAGQRFIGYVNDNDQDVTVLHFGDHDPSGIDMSRDIEDRLTLFMDHEECGDRLTIHRVALNMNQVEQYSPPPNPAKVTDSRAHGYIARHGRSSWELDALEPTVLADLVTREVLQLQDEELWDQAVEQEDAQRRYLGALSGQWDNVVKTLDLSEEE
jgi:hypothetical protein